LGELTLISNNTFKKALSANLQKTLDCFIVGCATGLRLSDLRNLTKANLAYEHNGWHIKTISQKTNTFTCVKLPQYAIDIIQKYTHFETKLLPVFSTVNFNKHMKAIAKSAGWTEEIPKFRLVNGTPQPIYKHNTKEHFQFCDHISSHMMRRTAITTMLTNGVPEMVVRKISGHAPGSKEFYRYVELAQSYLDNSLTIFYENIKQVA